MLVQSWFSSQHKILTWFGECLQFGIFHTNFSGLAALMRVDMAPNIDEQSAVAQSDAIHICYSEV